VLGRFLEYSISTPDIRASLEFYGKLGFTAAEVGEAWRHPYAVVTDGRICLGLHEEFMPAPSLTFVKPDLLRHLAALEEVAPLFEFRHLGNDVFNEVGWLDPSDHLVRLIEARTFSPSKRLPTDTSLCGYFLEIALPAADPGAAKEFWEGFGFVGIDEPEPPMPHVSCTSDSITLGLYDPAHLRQPALLFDSGDIAGALGRLAEAGLTPNGQVPAPLRGLPAAMLTAPEGTLILLLAGDAN
jgi:catechol 2,3-dioxygenase-like lactoylglutathione lyase family enzyme